MGWPFKHIRPESRWVFAPLLVQLATQVVTTPSKHRKQAAAKMIERVVRLSARLACEFGCPANLYLEIARAVILDEGGPKAAQQLGELEGQVLVDAETEEAKTKEEMDAIVRSMFAQVDLPEDGPIEA